MLNGCAVWYYTLIFLSAAKIFIWSFWRNGWTDLMRE